MPANMLMQKDRWNIRIWLSFQISSLIPMVVFVASFVIVPFLFPTIYDQLVHSISASFVLRETFRVPFQTKINNFMVTPKKAEF